MDQPRFGTFRERGRSHRVKVAVGCALALVVAGGSAAVGSGWSNADSDPVAATNESDANSALASINAIALSDPNFLLVKGDPQGQVVTVYRKGGTDGSPYPSSTNGFSVAVQPALLNRPELETTLSGITKSFGQLDRLGTTLVSVKVGGNPGGPVVVRLSPITEEAKALVRSLAPYGPHTVMVAGA